MPSFWITNKRYILIGGLVLLVATITTFLVVEYGFNSSTKNSGNDSHKADVPLSTTDELNSSVERFLNDSLTSLKDFATPQPTETTQTAVINQQTQIIDKLLDYIKTLNLSVKDGADPNEEKEFFLQNVVDIHKLLSLILSLDPSLTSTAEANEHQLTNIDWPSISTCSDLIKEMTNIKTKLTTYGEQLTPIPVPEQSTDPITTVVNDIKDLQTEMLAKKTEVINMALISNLYKACENLNNSDEEFKNLYQQLQIPTKIQLRKIPNLKYDDVLQKLHPYWEKLTTKYPPQPQTVIVATNTNYDQPLVFIAQIQSQLNTFKNSLITLQNTITQEQVIPKHLNLINEKINIIKENKKNDNISELKNLFNSLKEHMKLEHDPTFNEQHWQIYDRIQKDFWRLNQELYKTEV